jgi:hypothetical protein
LDPEELQRIEERRIQELNNETGQNADSDDSAKIE